jgi:hypothetical protein
MERIMETGRHFGGKKQSQLEPEAKLLSRNPALQPDVIEARQSQA